MWIDCIQDDPRKKSNGEGYTYPLNMDHVIFFIAEIDPKYKGNRAIQYVAMDVRGMRHRIHASEFEYVSTLVDSLRHSR